MSELQIFKNEFDYQAEINFIATKYQKHGITMAKVKHLVESGRTRGLSVKARIIGIRMALAHEFGEEDYFTVDDLMEITGETREGALKLMRNAGVMPVRISWHQGGKV